MFFVISGLVGFSLGWLVAFLRKRVLYDQLHSAAVTCLIFTILSVVYVVIAGWIALG